MLEESKIVILSNVFEQSYHCVRGEMIARVLDSKRQILFRSLQQASDRRLLILSSPPKGAQRRRPKWLPAMEAQFAGQRQLFCATWDMPKLRIPLSWFFYARHVVRHVRSGDLVMIDNYEFIYVFAARWLKFFRRVTFVLDYEDGKHLIDRAVWRLLSRWAEALGRPLLSGALLAHPALGDRLPAAIPTTLVPGFVPNRIPQPSSEAPSVVRFLYSGTLDSPRGVDLLLDALKLLPEKGWHLDITGNGPLEEAVTRFSSDARWQGRVKYHQALPSQVYDQLKSACHVGLNCQRASDPISGVTFPSKLFAYFAAGLAVISSRASEVSRICEKACLYYDEETANSLAAAMNRFIAEFSVASRTLDVTSLTANYSMEATSVRLKEFLRAVHWPK